MVWLYVPGLVGSNSVSDSHLEIIAASVTRRGKLMESQFWRPVLETASWMKLLSGITLKPSMAARGVEEWISSLLASPASLGAMRGYTREQRTRDGYGLKSPGSFARWNQEKSSWRMFQVSLTGEAIQYSDPWPKWGSMRNGVSSRRQSWEPPTSGRGYSYWPTPLATGGPRSLPEGTTSTGRTPEGKKRQVGLLEAIQMSQMGMWPTPTAADSSRQSPNYMRGNRTLIGAVKERETYPTPTKSIVPTPTASDAKGGLGGNRGGGPNLKTVVGGKLNPPWDEWLMGLPIGWTGSEPVAMESFRQWQRKHMLNCEVD